MQMGMLCSALCGVSCKQVMDEPLYASYLAITGEALLVAASCTRQLQHLC
jgi:hypothetical protein